MLLQQKYSNHQVYKQYENHIYVTNDELVRVFNEKTKGRRSSIPSMPKDPYSVLSELWRKGKSWTMRISTSFDVALNFPPDTSATF